MTVRLFLNIPFHKGNVFLASSYWVYISLVLFARVYTEVSGFNVLILTGKLLQEGCRYQMLLKTFTKLYNRYQNTATTGATL